MRLASTAALLASLALSSITIVLPLATTSAQASYDPVGAARTTLTLDKRFLRFLSAHNITLTAKAGAKRTAKKLTLPAAGGEVDPTIEKGTVDLQGTLLFAHGRRSLPLRQVTARFKRTPLLAKVGGSQLKVATARRIATSRAGFGTNLTATGLRLSAKVATRLNKKLGLRHRPFASGQPFASLRTRTQPLTVAILDRGRATIALDPALVAKLNGLFVSINPIFPTELAPGSTLLTVPIIRAGALAPDASLGTLRTAGAIEFLQQKAGQVFSNEFWFDLGTDTALAELQIEPTPTFRGKLGQLPALAIGPGATTSDPKARTITISSALLSLSAATAAAFNEGFAQGKPTFSPSEPFGTLSFTAQTQ